MRYMLVHMLRVTSVGQNLEKVIPATMPVTSVAPPIMPAVIAFSGATVLKLIKSSLIKVIAFEVQTY